MSRYKYQGTMKDGDGHVIGTETTSDATAGTITVYLAGGTTAATVYAAESGGSSVGYVSTNTHGFFEFWVDDTEYDSSQRFKIVLSHADFESQTYDDLDIIPFIFEVDTTVASSGTDGTISSRNTTALGECTGFVKITIAGGTDVYVPYWADTTP